MNRVVVSLALGLAACLNAAANAGPVVRFDTGPTGTNAIPGGLSLVSGQSYTFYVRLSGFPTTTKLNAYGLVIEIEGSTGVFDFDQGDFGFIAPTSTATDDFVADGFGVYPGPISGNSYVLAADSNYTSFTGVANQDTGVPSTVGRLALSDLLSTGGVTVVDDTNDLLAKVTVWSRSSYSGSLSIRFSGDANDTIFLDADGQDIELTTGDAFTLSITPIPEPSSLVLTGLAGVCVFGSRLLRRRNPSGGREA